LRSKIRNSGLRRNRNAPSLSSAGNRGASRRARYILIRNPPVQ
jgi:hypothetical protein